MDFSRIENSVISHITELFDWSERLGSKVRCFGDSLWENELWSEGPSDIEAVLNKIKERFDRVGGCLMSGKFMASVPNTGNYASCLAEVIRSQLDVKNSEVGRRIERVVIRWMCREFGLSPDADGYMTTGGSSSSVIAVAVARDAMGVQDYQTDRLVVYMTSMTHTCIDKALLVAGLGDVPVRLVELDELYRMDVADLEKKILSDKETGLIPFMVVATVGTVDCGSIDPVEEIAKVTSSHGLWLHLDAVFGSLLALCPETKDKVRGFELCDSVIIDGHKALCQPFGSGTVLFNEKRHLQPCHETSSNQNQFWSTPLEDNAMPRGFQIWFSLGIFGVKVFRDNARKYMQLAQYAAAELAACPRVVVLPVASFIVAFRYAGSSREESNERTAAWESLIGKDKRIALSSTSVDGFTFIRIAPSFRTHLSEVKFCLALVIEKLKASLKDQAEEKITKPKPLVDLTWLHQFEKKTTEMERHLRLNFTQAVLEDLHRRLCNTGRKLKSEDQCLEDEATQWLWPEEEARNIGDLMLVFKDVPCVEVPRPECRYAGVLGHFLASVGNTFSGKRAAAPGAVELEHRVVQYLGARFGMSVECGGVLSSDICTANILALLTARTGKLDNQHGLRRPVVYVNQEEKERFVKPLKVIGLSNCAFNTVDTDVNGGLDVGDLIRKVERDRKDPGLLPWVVCEVIKDNEILDTVKISKVSKELNLWYHVEVPNLDAAKTWSSDFRLPPKGLSAMNSLSIEIGSNLCLPVGVAAVIVADHTKLHNALLTRREEQYLPKYTRDTNNNQPSSYSFELSRPCRVLPLWFTQRQRYQTVNRWRTLIYGSERGGGEGSLASMI